MSVVIDESVSWITNLEFHNVEQQLNLKLLMERTYVIPEYFKKVAVFLEYSRKNVTLLLKGLLVEDIPI